MFVSNFWGTNRDEAFSVISTRVKHGQQTLNEVTKYYHERMVVEADYIKRLEKLNRATPMGTSETGTLKVSMDVLMVENTHGVANNQKQLKSMEETHRQLREFSQMYEKKTGRCLGHMQKVLAKLNSAQSSLEEEKARYREDCGQVKGLGLQIQTTWGRELEKYSAKLNKANHHVATSRKSYQMALTTYNELLDIYKKDWGVALSDLYKLELERSQCLKVNCFNWCNVIATFCVDQDAAVDTARTAFAQINPQTDISEYTKTNCTGNHMAEPAHFIDFLNGEADEGKATTSKVDYKDPRYNPILSKPLLAPNSNSSSHPGAASVQAASMFSTTNIGTNDLPSNQPSSPSKSGARRKPPQDYDSEHDGAVFSDNGLRQSQGSSKYSEPTNYTSSNYSSGTQRTWNSPRKGEKRLRQVQDDINRQSQSAPPPMAKASSAHPKVNIMKDFSVDFLSKALEDLNSGGTGDVSKFRKSVRRQHADEEQLNRSQGATSRPKSDYIDDSDEVAVRYESVNFNRPKSTYAPVIHHESEFDPRKRKSISMVKSQSKSFTDLRQLEHDEFVHAHGNDDHMARSHANDRRKSLPYPEREYPQDEAKPVLRKRHSMPATAIPTHTPVSKQPIVGKARAKFTFHPNPNPDPRDLNQQSEMFFRKGWTMYIIQRQEDDWYWAELSAQCGNGHAGKVGLVPGNYLDEGGEEIFQG